MVCWGFFLFDFFFFLRDEEIHLLLSPVGETVGLARLHQPLPCLGRAPRLPGGAVEIPLLPTIPHPPAPCLSPGFFMLRPQTFLHP